MRHDDGAQYAHNHGQGACRKGGTTQPTRRAPQPIFTRPISKRKERPMSETKPIMIFFNSFCRSW